MIGYIALCKKNGTVNRVIRSVPVGLINEGKNIRELFTDPFELDHILTQDLACPSSLRLRMKLEGDPLVYVTLKAYGDQLLLLVFGLDEPYQFSQLIEMTLSALEVPEVMGQDPYGAGYYEIQKLNSQLINYQRTMAKTNVRLQTLLKEMQTARSAIEILERDPLTGLFTEKVFYDRAANVLEKSADEAFDIAAVDIEQFKIVNDTFGAVAGDRLLMDLAMCLMNLPVDPPPLYTRARADTFFILLHRQKTLYDILDEHVSLFLERYPLPMRLQIRIGIYHIEDRALEVARMCDRALLAADSIKGSYGRRIAQYNHTMHEKLMLEQKIVNTMVESLQREDFQVYLQPKAEINTGRLIGAEALVRWKHPEFGMISPGDFIPVFEKNGFIYSLDLFVWRTACRMLRDWKKANRSIPISVNVSRTDLYHKDLPETLSGMCRDYDLAPDELHLEITESSYVRDSVQLLTVIRRLRQAGFIIEMDDFGSGYSSLNTLSDLPIDIIKLDMIFLRQSENNLRRQKVMQLIIDLARELDLPVIAEGVETEEQAMLLKAMGCPYAQGYLYGRPMPETEFFKYQPPRK